MHSCQYHITLPFPFALLTSDSDGVIDCSSFCHHLTPVLSCIISCHIVNRDDRPHPWFSGCGPRKIEGGSSHCLTGQIEGRPLGDSRGGACCEVHHNRWSNYRREGEGEGDNGRGGEGKGKKVKRGIVLYQREVCSGDRIAV